MTELEILKYAFHGALGIWSREYDRYYADPENPVRKAAYEVADEAYIEIRNRMLAEELSQKQLKREEENK